MKVFLNSEIPSMFSTGNLDRPLAELHRRDSRQGVLSRIPHAWLLRCQWLSHLFCACWCCSPFLTSGLLQSFNHQPLEERALNHCIRVIWWNRPFYVQKIAGALYKSNAGLPAHALSHSPRFGSWMLTSAFLPPISPQVSYVNVHIWVKKKDHLGPFLSSTASVEYGSLSVWCVPHSSNIVLSSYKSTSLGPNKGSIKESQ